MRSRAYNIYNLQCGQKLSRAGTLALAGRTPRTVAEVMTSKVITVRPSQSLKEIAGVMAKHSFRHYLVVEAPRRFVGVISHRDVVCALAREEHWSTIRAHDVMRRDVIPVSPDSQLSFAMEMMLSERFKCLPVVNDRGDVCGILTCTDLLNNCRAMLERSEKETATAKSVAHNLLAAGAELVDRLKR